MSTKIPGLEISHGIRVRREEVTEYLAYVDERTRDAALQSQEPKSGVTFESCRLWTGKPQTELATFDRQSEYLGMGNVWGTTQFSNCLRSTQDQTCNGFEFDPQALFLSDVDTMCRTNGGRGVFSYLRQLAKPDSAGFPGGWAYLFRYFDGRKAPVVVGGLVTDRRHQLIRRVDREDIGLRASGKARHALDVLECLVTDRRVVN